MRPHYLSRYDPSKSHHFSRSNHGYVHQPRAANTCADPSLADIVVQSYSSANIAHILDFIGGIVATDSTENGDWIIQTQSFRAWSSNEPFTVPLFRFFRSSPNIDYRYAIGQDISSPPTPPAGWSLDTSGGVAFAFIYPTQSCGSVPLMGVSNAFVGDHWYTTNTRERDGFIQGGWTDEGVVGFVLPL